MKRCSIALIAGLCILAVGLPGGQTLPQTGVIRGILTDGGDHPLPGASAVAAGPALMGTQTDVTHNDGSFRLPNLPPGLYSITVELPGFKTLKHDDIRVQTGSVVTIRLKTEPSALNEEVVVKAAAPVVDVRSTKVSDVFTGEMLARLPLNRNFVDMFEMIPGSAGKIDTYSGSINGGTPTNVSFELDGVNLNCPSSGGLVLDPQFDCVEEVEIATGSLPAQVGNSSGSYVNIVSKSGGNAFHGHAQVFHTGGGLTRTLFSDQRLADLGLGKPQTPVYDTDVSGSLGGPILKDRIWFFFSGGATLNKVPSLFIPTTIEGRTYDQYNIRQDVWRGLFKVTAQFSKSLRFFGMVHGELLNCDVYNGWDAQRTYEARFNLENNTKAAATADLTWLPGKNTFVDVRAGYVNHDFPLTGDPSSAANIGYTDGFTGYSWNGLTSYENYITRRTVQASARLTHFLDDFLGGAHEIGLGIETGYGMDRNAYARDNPLTWWYYDGNPYYYRGYYGLDAAHPQFGDGRLQFVNCGLEANDSLKQLEVNRWGGYVQDSFAVTQRLNIQAGLRLDVYDASMAKAYTTGRTGLAYEIGQAVVAPVLGFNPYDAFELSPLRGVIRFASLDPRVGLTWDPFGRGRSALKLSYSRYSEQFPAWRFSGISPDVLGNYNFHWWDADADGQPDPPGVDEYAPVGGFGQFTRPNLDYLRSRVDPGLKAPSYDEIVVSFNHEIFSHFSVKAQYLHKRGRNLYGNALYDQESGRYWYSLEDAPENYVPFTTTVPAVGDFPEEEVTIYLFSTASPYNNRFFRQTNMPESKRDYDALEMSFNKRYSSGWSLAGSVVLSRHMSFMSSYNPYSRRTPGASPNDYINAYGRDDFDRPLLIKLFGTFDLPLGFAGSFFYSHASGAPYARTVTILPPASWAAANGAVPWGTFIYLEPLGKRRQPSIDNVDIRLEKPFETRLGRLGLSLDMYNALGNKYVTEGWNPGGTWRPAGADGTAGTFTPDWSYGRAISVLGTRMIRLSFRWSF